MYRLKSDFEIPTKSLSKDVYLEYGDLILKNEVETWRYNKESDKWYLTNDLVKNFFMGYGCLPTYYTEYISHPEFFKLFEEVRDDREI